MTDKITPDMIGKVVVITVTSTDKDTPKRTTHFGNSYRGVEITEEPNTEVISATGRLAIYTVGGKTSSVLTEHDRNDWTMRWSNQGDQFDVTLSVEVV